MTDIKRVDIMGCSFTSISFAGTVAAIRSSVIRGERLQVVPGNVDFVMKAKRDPVFASELAKADLVVADGVPIAWAASLLGTPIRGRVSGTELVLSCAQVSASLGCPIALVGGQPGVAIRAAERMMALHSAARVHPILTPFPLGPNENAVIVKAIRDLQARIVLVALGAPKQERWIQANLVPSGAFVGIGVGSAFDIICGDQPRAPRILQQCGLEWFHRVLLDPKRLGKRYLVEDSPFLLYLAAAVTRRWLLAGGGVQ